MLTIDEAFRKFKSRLELNENEQKNASVRQNEIRDHLRLSFELDDDFLTGSYKRYTKTKPLKDVDIFCVLGKKEKHYRDEHPENVLKSFEKALSTKYGGSAVSVQRRSVTVDFGVVVDADDTRTIALSAWMWFRRLRVETITKSPISRAGSGLRRIRKSTQKRPLRRTKRTAGNGRALSAC